MAFLPRSGLQSPELTTGGRKAEQTVGVVKEVTSGIFRVRDFSYICTPGAKVVEGTDVRELEQNAVSSGPILQAGPYSFKVIVAWSLSEEGAVTDYSMLGIAVQRVNSREEPIVMQLELKLVNRENFRDITMRSNIQPLRKTLGWYPSPNASANADGFMPLKSVLDSTAGWLVDDTLTVECKMTVSLSKMESVLCLINAPPDTMLDLGTQFGELLDSGRFADVVLRIGEEQLRAHSVILAARSPVFDAMWATSMREQAEKEVIITDLDMVAVQRMIRFMYTGDVVTPLSNDNETTSILEAAHRYQVLALVELCVNALSSRLTVDIVAERLCVADLVGLDSLRRACLTFITSSAGRLAAVQATEGFSQLAKKRPHLALDILASAIPPTVVETIAV